jgi:hypothetical protein
LLEVSFANWIGHLEFIRKPMSNTADFSTVDSLTDQFRLNPDRKVTVENYFGSPLVVIDDLYANPEAVRNAALGLNYYRSRHSYPGSDALLWIPGHQLCPMMDSVMTSMLRKPVEVDPFHGIAGSVPKSPPEASYDAVRPPPEPVAVSPGNINPRDIVSFTVLRRNAQIRNQPHFDGGDGFALLVYLNPEEQCRGGTALYRHIDTGLHAKPNGFTREKIKELQAKGYKTESELYRALTWVSASNTGKEDWEPEWKLERVIEMRWNRLVCYHSSTLHSIFLQPGDFGDTLDTTRLTMNMFLTVSDYNQEDSPQVPQIAAG